MMNAVAVHIADLLLSNNKNQKYCKDVYVYGIEIFISNILSLLSIIMISVFLSDGLIGVIFLLVFCPLRIFTGGYHADTYGKCFVVGNISFLFVYTLNTFLWNKVPLSIVWCGLLAMSLYILEGTPIINPLQQVSIRIQKRSRRLAKYLLVMYSIFILLLSFWNKRFMFMVFLSIGLVAVFMIIAEKRKEV